MRLQIGMRNLFVLILIFIFFSCSTQKKMNEFTYWVNSTKVDCMGIGPMSCMQVQKGSSVKESQWTSFYSAIDGFDYEPGYLYKLQVREESISKEAVPADASSIKYTLVKVLDKQIDNRSFIKGKWLLMRINGNPVNRSIALPTLEIDMDNFRISGSTGCNTYSGLIQRLNQETIQLGNVVSTRKACINRNIETVYLNALNEISTYRQDNDKLVLFGEKGNELLAFLKQKGKTDNEGKQ